MEDAGHQLAQTDEVTSRRPTSEESEALQLAADEPVIEITRVTGDAQQSAVLEVTKVTAAASRNRFLYNV